jgi:hypothetical protein
MPGREMVLIAPVRNGGGLIAGQLLHRAITAQFIHDGSGSRKDCEHDTRTLRQIIWRSKILGKFVLPSQKPRASNGVYFKLFGDCNLVSLAMSDKRDAIVGRRLRHLRQALGYRHGNTFAAFLGIPPSRWNNLENGFPLSKEVAFLLVRRISGLSLDWLYFGRTDGLSMRLGRQLGEFADPPTASRRNSTTS